MNSRYYGGLKVLEILSRWRRGASVKVMRLMSDFNNLKLSDSVVVFTSGP